MWNELIRRNCRDCGPDDCYCMSCQNCDEAYDLIDGLLINIGRLEHMVAGAREEVNALAPHGGQPRYPMTYEDLCDGTYDSHPAMLRYMEFYGENAFIPWSSPTKNKRAVSEVSTTGRRRREVKSIMGKLERIRNAEEVFMSRIPENLQAGEAYERAEENIECLDNAIECLEGAY